jgi:hypothetical protein
MAWAVWIDGKERGGRYQMRTAGIGGGRDETAMNHRRTATEKGDGDGVKWLDLRREPGSEMPDESGGDGRVRDETGANGWTTMEAAVGEGMRSRSGRRNRRKKVGVGEEGEKKEKTGGAG